MSITTADFVARRPPCDQWHPVFVTLQCKFPPRCPTEVPRTPRCIIGSPAARSPEFRDLLLNLVPTANLSGHRHCLRRPAPSISA